MPDASYPIDATGHNIRKGDTVLIKMGEPYVVMTVHDVRPAADLKDGSGNPLPCNGEIVLRCEIHLPFAGGHLLSNMFALKATDLVDLPEVKPNLGGSKPQ